MDTLNLNEKKKIMQCFFLTMKNIWVFTRIVLMNSSPEFLIAVI